MNGGEANTAFAVIANWRGQSLDDGERAAWKHQLWRMDADEFDLAIQAWSRGPRANFRPSLSDLWALIPGKEQPAAENGPTSAWKGHGYDEPTSIGRQYGLDYIAKIRAERGWPTPADSPNRATFPSSPEVNR